MKNSLPPGSPVRRFLLVLTLAGVLLPRLWGNLIPNGNFQAGNTGFSTDYTYTDRFQEVSQYGIVANPRDGHCCAAEYYDHTYGDSRGLMLAENGGRDTATDIAWSVLVKVKRDTDYHFSMWYSSWTEHPAYNELVFNSGEVSIPFYTPEQAAVWKNMSFDWNSGSSTSLRITIFNLDLQEGGNDFAFDDISLTTAPDGGASGLLLGGASAVLAGANHWRGRSREGAKATGKAA